jgi:hypothetical protein
MSRGCTRPGGRALLALAMVLACAAGCQGRAPASLDRSTLTRADINVFIHGHRINYYGSTFPDVRKAFGRSASVFTARRYEADVIGRADFVGTAVEFVEGSGRLLGITSTSEEVRLAGDLGVGSSREQVTARLRNAVLSPDGSTCMFLLESPGGDHGDGYLFSFDEAGTVTRISFGRVPLAP